MAETFKNLAQSQITTSSGSLYTAPSGTGNGAIIKEIRIVNTDTAASHWFILYKGGTAAANQITGQITLAPNETFIDTGPVFLGASVQIYGDTDTASMMTVSLGGLELS